MTKQQIIWITLTVTVIWALSYIPVSPTLVHSNKQTSRSSVVCCTSQPNKLEAIFKHVRKARAFSHLIPHLHSCRFSSPVLSWTIAMFSLGVGPWTGEATQQEVETWVLCLQVHCLSVHVGVVSLCYISVLSPWSSQFFVTLTEAAMLFCWLSDWHYSPVVVCVLRGILILKAECLLLLCFITFRTADVVLHRF